MRRREFKRWKTFFLAESDRNDFGIINRRAIKRGDFPSLAALQEWLTGFIEYFNQTFAKPFNWTYTGHPTQTADVQKPKTWRQLW